MVVSASVANEHGWKTKWHSEYNRYICHVRIVSEEPKKIPWNTSKTAMRLDSTLYLEIKDELQPIADYYRAEIKKRYPSKTGKDPKSNPIPPKVTTDTPKDAKLRFIDKNGHTKRPPEKLHRDRPIFVDWDKCKTRVPQSHQKAYEIFAELCNLSSQKTPIACLAMLRVFIERTFKDAGHILFTEEKNKKKFAEFSLAGKGKAVAHGLHSRKLIDKGTLDVVEDYANTNSGLLSFNNIQSQMHSKESYPSHSRMNNYWDELDPFLAACWVFISQHT